MPGELTRLRLRRYQAPDHDKVWDLHNLALDEVGANGGNGPWDDDLHAIEKVYLEGGGEFLVGEHEAQIVAMGALKRTTDARAEIKRMRVRPGFQRCGFGQQILTALEQRARELGFTTLHLDTTVQQIAAQRLYEKNDFVLTREDDVRGFHVLFYEKCIVQCRGEPEVG